MATAGKTSKCHMDKPTTGPVCPNHGCRLEGLPFPLPKKGTGMCPKSGYSFDYEIEGDDSHMTQDKFGNPSKVFEWKVSGDENK